MSFDLHDTIAALSSPPGPAPRGIIRVSGPQTQAAVDGLFTPDDPDRWSSTHRAERHCGVFTLVEVDRRIPVSVYFWPDERSFTGQPMAEIHTVGSPPLLEAMLTAIYAGATRPARRGEFTLRSFLAGKIDLFQAEAVLGVIDADDQRALNSALEQLAGGISHEFQEVREDLLALLADLEAGLDFVDEDIEFVPASEVLRRLQEAETVVEELLSQAAARMRTADRATVALAGPPNAGKSTLFNAYAGRNAALVSEVAGTTRDYLAIDLKWGGLPVRLLDTAGWEEAKEGPLQSALALRHDQLQRADLIIWCRAADDSQADSGFTLLPESIPKIRVLTKCDLANSHNEEEIEVCSLTGAGLENLSRTVVEALSATNTSSRLLGTTGARCRDSLRGALEALQRAIELAESGFGDELLSIEIRVALEELGKVSGAVYTDDILDRIFSKFCIGK